MRTPCPPIGVIELDLGHQRTDHAQAEAAVLSRSRGSCQLPVVRDLDARAVADDRCAHASRCRRPGCRAPPRSSPPPRRRAGCPWRRRRARAHCSSHSATSRPKRAKGRALGRKRELERPRQAAGRARARGARRRPATARRRAARSMIASARCSGSRSAGTATAARRASPSSIEVLDSLDQAVRVEDHEGAGLRAAPALPRAGGRRRRRAGGSGPPRANARRAGRLDHEGRQVPGRDERRGRASSGRASR